jgi:hypothetical protein
VLPFSCLAQLQPRLLLSLLPVPSRLCLTTFVAAFLIHDLHVSAPTFEFHQQFVQVENLVCSMNSSMVAQAMVLKESDGEVESDQGMDYPVSLSPFAGELSKEVEFLTIPHLYKHL